MPGFSAQIAISAAPAEVFAFVSKTANMPRYLPTLEKATRTAEDRVRLKGAANGRRYEVEGHLLFDEDALQISWGSLEPQRYHGACQIFETDEGSELACRIEFEPHLQSMEALFGGADADFVTATLDGILRAVKQAVESRPQRAAGKSCLEAAGKDAYKLVF
jgi:uncharacterized membrane protein